MSFSVSAVQAALYGLLADEGSPLAAGGVHDQAPDNVQFPHIIIGDWQVLPEDVTDTSDPHDAGAEYYVDLHVWSRYRGNLEALQIMERLWSLADAASLTVPGRSSVLIWPDAMRGPFSDADGLTRHGVVTLKIVCRS